MSSPHHMDCPECADQVAPMRGSTWAIAWYSCGKCGTFWYSRLRVGPDMDRHVVPMISAGGSPTPVQDDWSLEELEAEADALRRESETLPKGNLAALRLHLEKLKVLADAINHRLETHSPATH